MSKKTIKLSKSELSQLIETIVKEEIDSLNEDNFDKVMIPANVKRWMNRFIDATNSVKLERIKKLAILYKIIKALGIDAQELNVYVGRLRRGLK
tara:strand:- start:500 stop:781 length:282 start_codon:yes stop_codon:yes gene_type:complete